MNWFDGLFILSLATLVLFEMRQEAGRGLLDTIATLAAAQLSAGLAVPATAALQWKPLPGTETAPMAQGLCFAGLLVAGLGISCYLHRQMRWTMDHFDPCFGVVFGTLLALAVGHMVTDVAAGVAVAKGEPVPQYLTQSLFGEELRSFKSYQQVLQVFHSYQNGR